MRGWLYQSLIYCALPLVAWFSWRKCSKARAQQPRLQNCFVQKFGRIPKNFKTGGLIIHAVSLGETRSILPLIKRLQNDYPDLPITLTNGSVRGAKQLVSSLPKGVQYSFLPLDYRFAVRRFLRQLKPQIMMVVETEIWPNLIQECHQQDIPLHYINARLKKRSLQQYQKLSGQWISTLLNKTEHIHCQFKADYQNFFRLGVDENKLSIMGNLKFDLSIDEALKSQAEAWKKSNLKNRFTWIAASTHEHEESQMLEAHQQLLKYDPNALLIIIPRQADRFDYVAALLDNAWSYQKRSEMNLSSQSLKPNTTVILGDSVGEMLFWMASCDVAFIGGSMVDFGGHNILEPAAFAKPVLSGPHYQNLAALYQVFIDTDALTLVHTPTELAQALAELQSNSNLYQQQSERAQSTFQSQSGSLNRLMEQLRPLLKS